MGFRGYLKDKGLNWGGRIFLPLKRDGFQTVPKPLRGVFLHGGIICDL